MTTTHRRGLRNSAVLLLATTSAPAASAQVATWFWTVSDTGNGDGIIEPDESALLTLWMAFDPPNHGFSLAGPYDIVGDDAWMDGVIRDADRTKRWPDGGFDNLLFFDVGANLGFGDLQADNSITGIEHFQLSEFMGPNYNRDNPIALFFLEWTPGSYDPRAVTIDNGGPDAYIYTDHMGENILYRGTGGSVTFQVVPSPAAGPLLALAALGVCRRRR